MIKKQVNDMKNSLNFFLKNKIKVHIDLLDGTFLNGFLVTYFKSNKCYLLEEVKLGKVYVFFNQIKVVEQFIERSEKDGGRNI